MTATDQTPFPPGARILVRDTEWLVRSCAPTEHDGYQIRATGVSEFVREEDAVFFTALEDPKPALLRPEETMLVRDHTPGFAMSRLYLEATLRRTPLPQSERGLAATPDGFLLDKLTYQQRPAELALQNLRPRILLADVVGLGKTLEIGLILAELIRRGRGDRILVVTPQQVLEQFQLELWTRFAIPLIRLDSLGIDRIQREIPVGRNPFTYYKRIIISIDTLKNEGRYGHHLDAMRWDAVVIDESHNLIGSGERNLRRRLAQLLAKQTDALLLASATPHNGDARSFAELIGMLDPAAIADDRNYAAKDIAHLYIRRTKISKEVTNEIGGKWRERGPSQAIRCPASPAEEAVFAELTRVWLADPALAPGGGHDRRLFPYTLLKTFLSSHKALAVTARKRAKNTSDQTERAALTHLAALADQVTDDDSAKLTAVVAKLREIGVGPHSATRAVVFSESVPTLEWLRTTLPGQLGLTRAGQVELMHGALSDTQQQAIIERFSLSDSPVRVLLTGDVASEGVNMHRQCHHLIHYDLPWSLIRIEQRNGRIDRYGQVREPEFAALILTSQTEGAKDDTTVAEKLLAREATAHRQLGTAEGVTRQFTSKKEEDRLVKDLLAGKTVDESIDAADGADPGADFLADLLAGVGDQPANPAPDQARVPRLFGATEAFARAALGAATPELRVDDDGEMLAFKPPDDLVQRLSVLPPSYLKKHDVTERMRVTFNRALAQRKLDEARQTQTLWPEIAYLSDLHPMIEWLTDKVLIHVPRQQAPVLIADVTEPAFLVQGVYSNTLGQPTVVEWMAVTGLPAEPRVDDMAGALERAKVGPDMVNTLRFGDLARLQDLVPAAVGAARSHLEDRRASYDATINGPIEEYRTRLATWEQLSLDGLQPTERGKRDRVRETAGELGRLTEALRTAGEPLLRILAVLTGEESLMSYDSITNRGDYLSPHYLAEVLPRDLKKQGSLRARWAEREKAGLPTPVRGLRGLRREYFDARLSLKERGDADQVRKKELIELNGALLRALGFPAEPRDLDVDRAGEPFGVPVAHAGRGVLAIDCDWATDTDAAFDADGPGRLLTPVEVGSREKIETGAKLARWLFAADEPPRYVLLLHGGVIVLADRLTWGEGRYLAVSLDAALERADAGELELIAALFSADALQAPAEGGEEPLATFVAGSRQHAVGVSAELREGLRESVQIIANEVLDRLREQGVPPGDIDDGTLARNLGRQSLRYLYRILFLLYAEARPELGILPVDDEDYMAGYSMARLGDLIARRLGGEEARKTFHLYESLAVLFRMVNDGHPARGGASADGLSEGAGLRFEALKADLFDPARTRLIGSVVRPGHDEDDPDAPRYDTRLRDGALYRVLRRLMLSKGGGVGRGGRRGRTERGGFISYAQLGISQLGAVYEGLMSYTGFVADEELYEVAKNGDPSGGSWMIPASKVPDYADAVFVRVKDENGIQTQERARYRPGSFVYRLAGRDRQTSASYYTPQSLTSVTVQLALEQRVKEQGGTATAAEVLRWRVCEPALGSGAFLNEAIDQLAALYLRLREEEADTRLEPEDRAMALQRVKAYIALHNCYGVDLNETAVELAEVSIWLNVMHRGLQAPWFGLHLVRGNSLIGAGRRLYPAHTLTKGEWLDSAPVDQPFSAGEIPPGHVHHFLLPAFGWGAVAGEKEAKELAPDQAKQLGTWRRQLRKPPSDKRSRGHKLTQLQRLQALSVRAEYLWSLVIERLRISEREISRPIDVWRADDLPRPQEAIPRDKIVADLTVQGTPYWRLKTVMDAWCALWFWPLDKAALLDGSDPVYKTTPPAAAPEPEPSPVDPDPAFPMVWEMDSLFGETPKQLTLAEAVPRKPRPKPAPIDHRPVPLAILDDWLDFAEALLGRQDVAPNSLASHFTSLTEIEEYEDKLESDFYMHMDSVLLLGERFPWLDAVENIAADQGFFHWELRFASVFADGGFDLQVGNPPWVRPIWEENSVLAEFDPWFELQETPPVPVHNARKAELLSMADARGLYIGDLTNQAGMSTFFGNVATYDLLVGTQPDMYRAFMARTWRNIGYSGVVGLLHPDTHFVGDREKFLRAEAYKRLRVHGDFVNSSNRFFPPPVNRSSHFGVHIYSRPKEIRFAHLGWLLSAVELPQSLALAETGKLPEGWDDAGRPGVKYKGDWDTRPHPDRVVWVDHEMLAAWRLVSGSDDQPIEQTKLLNPVTTQEQDAVLALGRVGQRLGDLPRISSGYHEKGAKNDGLIRLEQPHNPVEWSEVILRGPQIGVATPFFKQPPETGTKGRPQDLMTLPDNALPRSEYTRATDIETYRSAQDKWVDYNEPNRPRRYTEFYRVMWRYMIPDDTDRSLFPAIYPPGPAHIHGVRSLAMSTIHDTVLVAGFLAALPIDYLLRITKTDNFDVANASVMPAPDSSSPLAAALLLRTLRLNCLTTAYADLWAGLYEDARRDESWVVNWPNIAPLGDVNPAWEHDTPLRTEYERRAALVEIDALVAVWLGITEEQLEAIYPARYPILGDYEDVTWFDATGRKLAGNWNTFGTGQTKEHWEQFQAYREARAKNPPPDGYTPPFYKADRIAEYRQAHAAFTERMKDASS